jgi:branched-chain amino acid transport system ATP-binding protein
VFLGPTAQAPPQAARSRSRPEADTAVVLRARGLTKCFGGLTVVDDLDLDVPTGAIVGLIGHNGAGKTTVFDLLCGFLTPDTGTITLHGTDLTAAPAHHRALAGLGRSFQDARLYPALTVAETLAVALDRHLVNRDPLAVALWLPAAFDVHDAVLGRVEQLLETLRLTRYRDHRTAELSTGTRRIVELGCALAQAPDVLLLDEPSAGLAQRETEALVPVLRRVQAELGCALVIVEHDMALMSALCDILIALEDVLAHPAVISSYLGSDPIVVARSGPRIAARA